MMAALLLLFLLPVPASAAEYTAPTAPQVEELVPKEADSFGQGLWNVIKAAVRELDPTLADAASVCLRCAMAVLLTQTVGSCVTNKRTLELVSAIAVGAALLEPSAALISLGVGTVRDLSDYGKLLLPVMTGALAAQGGSTSSAGLYAVTALFDSVLSSLISGLLLPVVWLFLALAIAFAALGQPMLGRLRDLCKGFMTWCLKTVLYLFTGFLTITGVVSGSADATALKAAKLTISGAVPVVGGILSDASEAVLVGAGLMKNSAGIYGLLTITALFLTPFLRMGVQYLLLKAASALCAGSKAGGLMGDFAGAMGLILAMTAAQTVLLMVSTVCFMKGVGQ